MKTLTLYAFVIPLLLVSLNAHGKQTPQPEDVLDKAASMNSEHHPVPTTSYRKGHVSHHPVKHYVKINKQGYVIELPGNYPIATPTFYKGRLYVSGGFGSRQFHSPENDRLADLGA